MTKALGAALHEARKKRGFTQQEVADAARVSRPAVGLWEAGKNDPETANLAAACDFLGIDMDSALRGIVKFRDPPSTDAGIEKEQPSVNPAVTGGSEIMHMGPPGVHPESMPLDVPVYGLAVGGDDGEFYFNGETVNYVRRPPGIRRLRNVYAIHYFGDSMWPKYEEGDILYVSSSRPPSIGDYVVIELHPDSPDARNGPGYVKRLVKRTSTRIVVEQFNPARQLEFETERVKSLHRIIPTNELLGV